MQLLTTTLAASAALAGGALAANFTGDVLNGVPVIHDLNLADVPAQTVSKYYLRVGELLVYTVSVNMAHTDWFQIAMVGFPFISR